MVACWAACRGMGHGIRGCRALQEERDGVLVGQHSPGKEKPLQARLEGLVEQATRLLANVGALCEGFLVR